MRSCEEDETLDEQPGTHGLALANRKQKLGFDDGHVCALLCETLWGPIPSHPAKRLIRLLLSVDRAGPRAPGSPSDER